MTLCIIAMVVPIVVSVVFPPLDKSGLLDVLIIVFDLGALGLATRVLIAATHRL